MDGEINNVDEDEAEDVRISKVEAKNISKQERVMRRRSEEERRKAMLDWRPVENKDPLIVTSKGEVTESLRDLWKGSSAFLVGGGPSLLDIDTSKLAERGIASLGINNVAGKVRTSMFTCSDPPMKFHHGIWLDPTVMKLVPTPKLRQHIRIKVGSQFKSTPIRVKDCPNVWGYERSCALVPEEFITSPKASWGRNNKGVKKLGGPKVMQTMFLGLRLLHYLGVRRIYLLGVDFRMDRTGGRVYAFNQKKEGNFGNNDQYRDVVYFLELIKPHLEASGIEVFNCNPKSGLTIWPHVPFEEAVQGCRGLVPEGEFDLQGWYEKRSSDDNYTEGQRG